MTAITSPDPVRVYWQPGCTSCLRTKEFLTRQGVAFESRNVLEDEGAFRELERFGLRQVPIVTRGDQWANGQVLADVARVVGIKWGGAKVLPVPDLQRRLETILAGAERFLGQLPDHQLQTFIPNRPHSYAELVYHIFNIADAFLEHEAGIPLNFLLGHLIARGGSATPIDWWRAISRFAKDTIHYRGPPRQPPA